MTTENTLIQLTRTHHDVLACARQLQVAAAAPEHTVTPFRQALKFLEGDLAEHLAGEDHLIAPFATARDGVADEDATRMVTEHMFIRAAVTRLRRAVDAKDLATAAQVAVELGELLDRHIAFEELSLYPRLQEEVSAAHEVQLHLLPRVVHPHSLVDPLIVPASPDSQAASWSGGGASEQLNCTSVRLAYGRSIAWHANNERDIALVVTAGELTVALADLAPDRAGHEAHVQVVTAGSSIVIPAGSWRQLTPSAPAGAAWVSVHAARPGLAPA